MINNPLVSIITVVYNGEKYLEQTIQSVINQGYSNIEYIVIDGGSTDGTVDIIKKYQNHIDYWISEPDKGLYDAMNKGIKKANGELIGMINSDDWFEPNAVELAVETYVTNPEKNIFHGSRYDVYPDGTKSEYKFNPSINKFKYFRMTYSHPSMFITKREYEKHTYNIALKSHSDYQFTLEAFNRDKTGFIYIPKPLVNFRLGGVSGQLSFTQELKESYLARKNAGMSTAENIFSIFLKVFLHPLVVLNKKAAKAIQN